MENQFNKKHGAREGSLVKGDHVYVRSYHGQQREREKGVVLKKSGKVLYDVHDLQVGKYQEKTSKPIAQKRSYYSGNETLNLLLDAFNANPIPAPDPSPQQYSPAVPVRHSTWIHRRPQRLVIDPRKKSYDSTTQGGDVV